MKNLSYVVMSALCFCVMPLYASHTNYDYKGERSVPCAPDHLKDGLYIGAGIGYDAYRERQSFALTDTAGFVDDANPTIGAKGVLGEIFAGYGRYFNWFYIGGELGANYSGANTSFGINDYRSSFQTRESYKLALLPGVKLSETTLLYARLGYVRTLFAAQERGTPQGVVNTSDWGNGYGFGVGFESLLYKNLSLRGEYTYTTYSTFSSAIDTRFLPTNNQFIFSLIYHIDYV